MWLCRVWIRKGTFFCRKDREKIKSRIKASVQLIREAPASDLKIDPIDKGIVRLVKELRVALEEKNEEAADLISGFVLKSVKEFRSDIVTTKEGVVEEELKLREDQIEQMLIVAEEQQQDPPSEKGCQSIYGGTDTAESGLYAGLR
ncbi:MAG: hypothetical protein ACLR6B_06875 [Blautia sp.]